MPGTEEQRVIVHLDKDRELRLTLNAMKKFKEMTGIDFLNIKSSNPMEGLGLGIDEIITLIWLCFTHEDKELTQEQVGDMVHLGNINQIMDAMNKAMDNALPEADGKSPLPMRSRPIG
jgi:hypothetical protein